jgi:uncharacterized membrane protein YdjX (TVP38/TMEM64 family)
VLAVAALAALLYWGEPLWAFFADQEAIQRRVNAYGPWGPLITIALNAAQVVLAPVPGYVIGWANGYLFGVWMGTLYSALGMLIGSAIAMVLSRRFGRPLVERLVNPDALARWDAIASRRGPAFFFLVFLVPGLPDDIVSFVVGLSALPIPRMIVLGILGRLPGIFGASWIGANAAALPVWAWVPLIAGMAVLAWLFLRFGDQVEDALVRVIQQLTSRRRRGEGDGACASEGDYPGTR